MCATSDVVTSVLAQVGTPSRALCFRRRASSSLPSSASTLRILSNVAPTNHDPTDSDAESMVGPRKSTVAM
ncbi:hypothetical protein BHE74_00027961, partial [Ensete ventricosum]